MSREDDKRILAEARLKHIAEEQKSDTVLIGGTGFGSIAIRALQELGIGLDVADEKLKDIKTRSSKQKRTP